MHHRSGGLFAPVLRALGLGTVALGLAACAISSADSLRSVDPFTPADAGDSGDGDSRVAEGGPSDGPQVEGGSAAPDADQRCGDGTCNAGETCMTCRQDCGACAPPCGDGMCNGTDTCTTCPGDCGACPPRCGDGMCNGADTCTSCASDCGVCLTSCGDGLCNGDDTCATCSGDCGACPPPCGELRSDRQLAHGQSVVSCDGRFTLVMQTDGNLVLYQGASALWNTDTDGSAGQYATMQTDGNFVLYDPTRALWASGTSGNPGAWLALQTDGNLIVYTSAGVALWTSRTGGR